MLLFVRMPFLMFDPKLHVITMGKYSHLLGQKLTNVFTLVAM
jgi:hypothetical protein